MIAIAVAPHIFSRSIGRGGVINGSMLMRRQERARSALMISFISRGLARCRACVAELEARPPHSRHALPLAAGYECLHVSPARPAAAFAYLIIRRAAALLAPSHVRNSAASLM